MGKKAKVIIPKKSRYFTDSERHKIIQTMLANKWSKRYTWALYTGEPDERGHLLRWMRELGYVDVRECEDSRNSKNIPNFGTNNDIMADQTNTGQDSFETQQLKKRIAELESQLRDAEM